MHDGEHEHTPGFEPIDERIREILQQPAADTRLNFGAHRGSLDDARRRMLYICDEAIGKLRIAREVPRGGLVELDLRFRREFDSHSVHARPRSGAIDFGPELGGHFRERYGL